MKVAKRFGAAMLAAVIVIGAAPTGRPVSAADPGPGPTVAAVDAGVPDPVTFVPEARRDEIRSHPEATIGFRSRGLLAPLHSPTNETVQGVSVPKTATPNAPKGDATVPSEPQILTVNGDSDHVLDVVIHQLPVVSGQVLDPHGTPLAGITVTVYGEQSNSAAATTDAAGMFSITWVYQASPTVLVAFSDPAGLHVNGNLGAAGFAPAGSPPATFTLEPDEILDASVTMPAYVQLTGHVTLAGGAPVSGGSVAPRTPGRTFDAVPIGVDGSFSITVAPGTYSLTVPGGFYGREGFAYETGAVEPFAVGDDGRDIDVVLPAGETIRGRVTYGSVGIAGIEVDVYLDGTPFTSGTSGSDGSWSIDVPPGAYLVGFYDLTNKYAHGWYGPSGYTSDPLAAKLVGVSTSGAAGINVALPTTKRVSGKVTDTRYGLAIAHAYVEAFVNGVFYSSQYASSTGAYNLPVAPGKVTLWVYDTNLRFAPGWRTATSLTANHAKAAITTVGSSNVSGVVIKAPQAALLSMSIGWVPAPGSWASADATTEAYANGAAASFDMVDNSGQHHMPLIKGSYRLWVDANNAAYGLTDGWYTTGGTLTTDFAAATVKTVTSTASLAITIPTGRGISGSVRDKDGYLIAGIDVQLYAHGTFYVDVVANGGYFSFVAPPGTYRMAFADVYGMYRSGWLGPDGFVADYISGRDLTVTSLAGPGDITVDLPTDTPPLVPTNVVATPYHQSAAVSFTASTGSLTRPIIHYAVTASPGGRQCITINVPSCLVTGLTNGTPYTFTATASSIVGSSVASSPSAPVAPLPVPNAPGGPSATASASDVGVSWTAPADNGSAIIGYLATVSPGGRTCTPTPATDTTCTVASLPDGRYVVSINATNAIGSGPAAAAPLTVDTVSPTISAPSTTLRSGLVMSGTSVPVTVTWSASDTLAGIADTTLELAAGSGSYLDQALGQATATSLQRTLASNARAYRFRDRALDASENLSGWATGPATYVTLRQETGAGIAYHGKWTSASSTSALGRKLRYTSSKGAYVTYTFTGRGVSFVSRKGSTSGKSSVYLDGHLVATVNLNSSATTVRWVAYAKTLSTSKKHVLKIVNLATSGHPRLYIDGFATIR